MNQIQKARLMGFERVAAFGEEYATDMEPEAPAKKPTKAQMLFAALGTTDDIEDASQPASVIGILGRADKQQLGGNEDFHSGTDNRGKQRKGVRRLMQLVRSAAISIGKEEGLPNIKRKFVMPTKASDKSLIAAARHFADQAEPLREQLTELKFGEDFLDTMRAEINAFEVAKKEQRSGLQNRTGARAIINEQVNRGQELVERLNLIMRNQYRDDPEMLAKWKSAIRVEQTIPGRKRGASKATATPAPAVTAASSVSVAAPAALASAPTEVVPRLVIPQSETHESEEAGPDRSISLNGNGITAGEN